MKYPDILIDGYNLLYKTSIKGNTLKEKREDLITKIINFCEINNNKAIIVFDAKNEESFLRAKEKKGKVKLIFSSKDETADDIILEFLEKKEYKKYVLISSDRKLLNMAKKRGVNFLKSEEFIDYL